MKTVPVKQLSTLKMVAGNEEKYPLVIDEGIVKRWVGFGWIDEGPPSTIQKKSLPHVERSN